MSGTVIYISSRAALLRERCEQQRQHLGLQIQDIEHRLQGIDSTLNTVRAVVTKPVVIVGGLAVWALMGRFGAWSLLSRGVMLYATARRIYKLFKS